MNTEWIYLALFGLMMFFCCYPMMRRLVNKPDAPEQPDEKRAGAETAGAKEALRS